MTFYTYIKYYFLTRILFILFYFYKDFHCIILGLISIRNINKITSVHEQFKHLSFKYFANESKNLFDMNHFNFVVIKIKNLSFF